VIKPSLNDVWLGGLDKSRQLPQGAGQIGKCSAIERINIDIFGSELIAKRAEGQNGYDPRREAPRIHRLGQALQAIFRAPSVEVGDEMQNFNQVPRPPKNDSLSLILEGPVSGCNPLWGVIGRSSTSRDPDLSHAVAVQASALCAANDRQSSMNDGSDWDRSCRTMRIRRPCPSENIVPVPSGVYRRACCAAVLALRILAEYEL
jgi:hypothetical protein